MRTISRTSRFKKDYKREGKGQYRASPYTDMVAVLQLLAKDQTLRDRYRDHALTGEYSKHRECYLMPDLLSIYKRPEETTLRLVRLGSQSELFSNCSNETNEANEVFRNSVLDRSGCFGAGC